MNPGILGEDETIELLAEVLHHVITLWFSMNEEVETNLFLEADDILDFLLDEVLVLGCSELSLVQLGASSTNFLSLLMRGVSEGFRGK